MEEKFEKPDMYQTVLVREQFQLFDKKACNACKKKIKRFFNLPVLAIIATFNQSIITEEKKQQQYFFKNSLDPFEMEEDFGKPSMYQTVLVRKQFQLFSKKARYACKKVKRFLNLPIFVVLAMFNW